MGTAEPSLIGPAIYIPNEQLLKYGGGTVRLEPRQNVMLDLLAARARETNRVVLDSEVRRALGRYDTERGTSPIVIASELRTHFKTLGLKPYLRLTRISNTGYYLEIRDNRTAAHPASSRNLREPKASAVGTNAFVRHQPEQTDEDPQVIAHTLKEFCCQLHDTEFRGAVYQAAQVREAWEGGDHRIMDDAELAASDRTDPPQEGRSLPTTVESRIDALLLTRPVADAVREVLTAESYPIMMRLSSESVRNPIWEKIPAKDRRRLAAEFSPFGSFPPRIMALDIFLLRANDARGNPYLWHYFSGKPKSGWQAYMLPFREKSPGESEDVRQWENAKDIAGFLLMDPSDISTKSTGEQFVVSVKPDPGYSELVLYIFKFCTVTMRTAPKWLACETPELTIKESVRRFKWIHPEEMERQNRAVLVDGDVLRAVHRFFTFLVPMVPVGFPSVFMK